MTFKMKILLGTGLVGILATFGSWFSPEKAPELPADLSVDQLPYSEDGPFSVGVHTRQVMDSTPFEVMVWYPGLQNETDNLILYDYEIKFQNPLGRKVIASYQGLANHQAAFDLSHAPYPVIVLSPGFSITPASYGWLAEHLASYGFVVISPDHNEILDPENDVWQAVITRPQDIHSVLDYIKEQAQAGGSYQGMIDPELAALVGHSYGGYTSLAAAGARVDTRSFRSRCEGAIKENEPGAWLCEKLLPQINEMAYLAGLDGVPDGLWPSWADPRVDAIVPMAGNAFFFSPASLSEIQAPVMAIGGTADEDSPYLWSTHPIYEYASSQTKIKIGLIGAEHMIFTGPCEHIPWYMKVFSAEFCTDQSWDRVYAHDLIKHFTAAFLLAELKENAGADAALAKNNTDIPGVDYQRTAND